MRCFADENKRTVIRYPVVQVVVLTDRDRHSLAGTQYSRLQPAATQQVSTQDKQQNAVLRSVHVSNVLSDGGKVDRRSVSVAAVAPAVGRVQLQRDAACLALLNSVQTPYSARSR